MVLFNITAITHLLDRSPPRDSVDNIIRATNLRGAAAAARMGHKRAAEGRNITLPRWCAAAGMKNMMVAQSSHARTSGDATVRPPSVCPCSGPRRSTAQPAPRPPARTGRSRGRGRAGGAEACRASTAVAGDG